MAALALQDMVEVVGTDLVRLDGIDGEDDFDSVERGPDLDDPEIAPWFYSVPFPGVRYYSF